MANLYNALGYLHTVADTDTKQPLWKAHAANALGQITLAQTGDGAITTRQYTPETGRIENINVLRSNVTLMDQHYTFDAIGKLTERSDTVNSVIQSLCYDDMNRLTAARTTGCTSGDSDYAYDALGNITSKLHVGAYQYQQTNNAGPHAVTAANGLTYRYDENGSLTEARNAGNQIVKQVQYAAFNKPTRIDNEANWTEITYGPDQTRIKREDNSGRVTYYFGDLYEEVIDGGITQRIHTVGDFALHIEKFGLETGEYNEYLHRDHLGSIVTRSTDRDSLIDQQAFGPWGQRLLIAWDGVEAGTGFEAPSLRGYTGHEHLDNVGLIHMNGRVYDPELGRFLSPDPFVQAPYNTQNYNRYSYVLNNPLSLTDPTGYFYGEADMMHAILMDSTMGNNHMMSINSWIGYYNSLELKKNAELQEKILKLLAEDDDTSGSGNGSSDGAQSSRESSENAQSGDESNPQTVRDSGAEGNAQKADSLFFNGKSLQWIDGEGNVIHDWEAISGRPRGVNSGRSKSKDYTGADSQSIEGKGPIPEGTWAVRQERFQIRNQNGWQELKSALGASAWPGGHDSWGDYRVWLEPLGDTNTYGRSGFSIHGGVVPGSAGCIDLCGMMPSFAQQFQSYGQDMVLTVKY